jgi:hypothetical protein
VQEDYVFAGVVCSRALQFRVWCAIQSAIQEYLRVERSKFCGELGDPRPCLLDCAGNGFNDAWGHPAGSHKYGDALDFGYFTTGATNRTQSYGPNRPLWQEYQFADMALFHPGRTARFLTVLLKHFPKMRWMVHKTIYLRLLPHMGRELDMASNVDENQTYNHDKHTHVYLFGFGADGKYEEGMIAQ